MINVTIKNVSEHEIVGGRGHTVLPPPFHLVELLPGDSEELTCTPGQLDEQWPHRSGFTVSDLLQQLVQLDRIRVDIQPFGGDPARDSKMEEVRRKLVAEEAAAKKAAQNPTPKPRVRTKKKPVKKGAPKKAPSVDEKPGDDMSSKDSLPDMVEADPLYGSPSERKKKKKSGQKASQLVPSDEPVEGSGIDLPELGEPTPKKPKVERHKDTFEGAIKMAFVGAGQGGGRIAQAFYDMGYRRVCAVNTTQQDLASLTMPATLVIGNNRGGAGKDPEHGRLAAKESYEDLMDLLMRSWGEGVEQMFVCVGAGGGSGTGSWPVLVKAMKEYGESTNVEKPITKHLGVIMTMPKRSEGSRVQKNALTALKDATELVEAKKISTLIIVDNAKIHDLYPGLAVKKFWPVTNQNFAAILHTFNLLAAQDSEYNTFDRADFRSVIRNGLLIFGMTRVREWEDKEDVSQAVRQNLTGSLLADGFDLSKANMAGAIVVAHDDVLGEVPMENIDYAFNSLGRSLGNEGITLHSGIYEDSREGMRVFTIVSGLEPPKARFEELEGLAT